MIKKNNCGELNLKNKNEIVEIYGWINKIRKLGSLIFIDLRDRYGITQIFLKDGDDFYKEALNFKNEYVLKVEGKVIERKSKNKLISTGDIEILVNKITVLNESKPLPFTIQDDIKALEDTRLLYRYLDLRRPILQNKIILKSKFINFISNILEDNKFINIETPILTKSTPEGARDFLVPSRINKNKFYALPQSPQLFKQFFMLSGFDRYYQFAKCFRDEDLRSDRQLEFLQLDLEMSFVKKEEIMNLIENAMQKFIFKFKNIKLNKFPILTYDECIEKYGTDKPDIRFPIFLKTLDSIFINTEFKIFKNIIKIKKSIRGTFVEKILSNNEIKKIKLIANQNNIKNVSFLEVDNNLKINGQITKFLSENELRELIDLFSIKKNGTIIIIADEYKKSSQALGAIRNELGIIMNLINDNVYSFLWVIDWPMFEYDNEKNALISMHHPFTSPINENDILDKNLDKTNLINIKANAYDLVLNGYEIGGGSIRIHRKVLQNRIFELLGLDKETINNKFGWFLKGFDFGWPPHGGIALGVDRIIMILTNSKSIRDTIPFPKNTNGYDLMLDAPNYIPQEQLNELNMKAAK